MVIQTPNRATYGDRGLTAIGIPIAADVPIPGDSADHFFATTSGFAPLIVGEMYCLNEGIIVVQLGAVAPNLFTFLNSHSLSTGVGNSPIPTALKVANAMLVLNANHVRASRPVIPAPGTVLTVSFGIRTDQAVTVKAGSQVNFMLVKSQD